MYIYGSFSQDFKASLIIFFLVALGSNSIFMAHNSPSKGNSFRALDKTKEAPLLLLQSISILTANLKSSGHLGIFSLAYSNKGLAPAKFLFLISNSINSTQRITDNLF